MKSLKDLQNVYVISDTCFLADVFERFRSFSLENFRLDPCCYVSGPGLSWEAMLLRTKSKVEIIPNSDMLSTIERGMRGGVTPIFYRQGQSNIPGRKEYDENKPEKHILLYDCLSLYGYTMTKLLPIGGYRWIEKEGGEEELKDFVLDEIMRKDVDGPVGYFIDCDITYPDELHFAHNEFPLCPEKRVVTEAELSPFQLGLMKKMKFKPDLKSEKLLPTLYDKNRYVTHFANLKYCLQKGLVLKKVYKVLQFDQKDWMSGYVRDVAELRRQTDNPIERNFYKFFINSLFGKSIQNLRKQMNLKVVADKKRAANLINSPNFERF